jgi:hypothetical protein
VFIRRLDWIVASPAPEMACLVHVPPPVGTWLVSTVVSASVKASDAWASGARMTMPPAPGWTMASGMRRTIAAT